MYTNKQIGVKHFVALWHFRNCF